MSTKTEQDLKKEFEELVARLPAKKREIFRKHHETPYILLSEAMIIIKDLSQKSQNPKLLVALSNLKHCVGTSIGEILYHAIPFKS
jgi:hypothetical protein